MNVTMIDSHSETIQRRQLDTDLSVTELMHENDIEAILWKGRPVNSPIVDTDGDIDLLVRSDDKQRAENILKNHGFRRVANSMWRNQPHVYDWYGISNAKLVHVQLYDQLILGSYASKQLIVPKQNAIFNDASPYSSDSVSAVLRICRATLLSPFHPGKKISELLGDARQLASTVEGITETAEMLFDDETARKIAGAYETGNIADLKRHLFQHFQAPEQAGGASFAAHILKYASNVNRRTIGLPVLPRRSLKRPAPIVALIGSDGSGKSTAAAESAKRINSKIDTRFIYFGTGDGESSLLRLPLVFLKRIREKYKNIKNDYSVISAQVKNSDQDDVPSLAKAIWAISVAWERRSKMKRASKYAAAGIIVITDRYPQNDVPGIHDGPRLSTWTLQKNINENNLKYRLAKWEQRIYEQLSCYHPDLVVLLDVDLQTASARRPDEPAEELERRIAVARQLKYGNARRVVINASEPLEVVLGKTMKTIIEAATIED